MNYEIRKIYEANTCRLDEEMSLLSHKQKIRPHVAQKARSLRGFVRTVKEIVASSSAVKIYASNRQKMYEGNERSR